MSITGLRKLVVFDPATGDLAQFDDVRNEGQLNLNSLEADEDTTGGIPFAGDESDMEAVVYNLGAPEAQVKDWMEANTRVSAAGLGHQVNFLWLETDRFRIQRPNFFAPGQRKRATITAIRTGGLHDIDHMVNLLLNDDLLSDPATNTKRFPFPIEGAELTLSRDFGAAPLDTEVTLRALDYDEVELASQAGSNDGTRTSATLELPPGTYYVECALNAAGGEPALRSDGKTEYIDE